MPITQYYERIAALREDSDVSVWRGRHRQLRTEWVIKQHADLNPNRLEHCFAEIQRWVEVPHDRLVRVFHADRGERVVIAESMAHSAADRIAAGPSSVEIVAIALRAGLEGIRALHERSYLHLNLKPRNVLLDAHGRVKLADGRCRAVGARQTLPPPGDSAKYLAPELFDDTPQIGPPSDLYSLGFVALEMLVGPAFSQHFQGARGEEFKWHVWHQTRGAESLSTRRLAPEAPAALAEILDRLLLKSPTQRYQRADEVLLDLRRGFGELGSEAQRAMSGGAGSYPGRASEVVLRVLSGPRAGTEFRSSTSAIRIGADEKCDVRLAPQQYKSIAKRAVEIRREADGWFLDGLGNTGIRVDDSLIAVGGVAPLRSGAIVRLSTDGPDFQFHVTIPGGKSLTEIAEQYHIRDLEHAAPTAPSRESAAPLPPHMPPLAAAPQAPAPIAPSAQRAEQFANAPAPPELTSEPAAHADPSAATAARRPLLAIIHPSRWDTNTRILMILVGGFAVLGLALLFPWGRGEPEEPTDRNPSAPASSSGTEGEVGSPGVGGPHVRTSTERGIQVRHNSPRFSRMVTT